VFDQAFERELAQGGNGFGDRALQRPPQLFGGNARLRIELRVAVACGVSESG
jgi:hypothetical protein